MGSVLHVQRELWERISPLTHRLLTQGKPELRQALRRFEQSFPENFRRISREQFLSNAFRVDWVLVGDFHSLQRAQLEAVLLIEELKPRTLALEIFPSCYQGALDLWIESGRSAKALLEMLEFEKIWGSLPRAGYEILLETARIHGLRLLAIDHPLRVLGKDPGIFERERHMALRLEALAEAQTLVLVGDVHLTPEFLPALLPSKRYVILHQNHAKYHFALEDRGSQLPVHLQISPKRYVYQSTHPLLVAESFLFAHSEEGLLHQASPEVLMPSLLEKLATLMEQKMPEVPAVLCTFEHEQRQLLTLMMENKKESQRFLDRLVIKGMSFLKNDKTLVMHIPGSNHLAEAAGKCLYRANSKETTRATGRVERFLVAITEEAVGFLSSLLVNPLRLAKDLLWYEEILDVSINSKRAQRLEREISDAMDRAAGTDALPARLPHADETMGLVLSRVLGQKLGLGLHRNWLKTEKRRRSVLSAIFRAERNEKGVEAWWVALLRAGRSG